MMTWKTWEEMTEAERAAINADEDKRESRKAAFQGSDDDIPEFGNDLLDIELWKARSEERADSIHHDSLYW